MASRRSVGRKARRRRVAEVAEAMARRGCSRLGSVKKAEHRMLSIGPSTRCRASPRAPAPCVHVAGPALLFTAGGSTGQGCCASGARFVRVIRSARWAGWQRLSSLALDPAPPRSESGYGSFTVPEDDDCMPARWPLRSRRLPACPALSCPPRRPPLASSVNEAREARGIRLSMQAACRPAWAWR